MTHFAHKNLSRRLVLAGGTAFLAAGLTAPAWAQSKEDFKIGAIASLTGPAAAYSKDYADGFMAYAKAWNERGGYQGRKVVVELLDDETSAVNAVNVFRRLVSDPKVNVVWFAGGSQTALGIKAIASEFKVPVVSGGGIPELGFPADPYFFKVSVTTDDLLKALIDSAARRGVKTMAILNATDAYGQTEAKSLHALTAAAGIKLVAAETFATTDTNFTTQLVKIRNAKPELFYNGATGGPAVLAFKQSKQLGLKLETSVSMAAISAAFFQGIGGREHADGLLSVVPLGALGDEMPGEAAKLYKQASDALGKPAILYHTLGWDTAIITEHAMNHSDGSREGIRDALDKAKDVPAINGPFTYRPDNHNGQDARGLILARFKDGKWTVAD